MCDHNSEQQLQELVKDISDRYDADVILYSGEISRTGSSRIIEIARKKGGHKNIFLVLATNGGDPDAAYRIARCLQRHYEKFILYIPGICKSAGTLVALGCDELVMSEYGELGPLDVQLGKTDELWEMVSGLNVTQALDSLGTRAIEVFSQYLINIRLGSEGNVSTKMAADIATNLVAGLYGSIYGQIDPVRLGEIERAINIAYDYGKRLERENLKDKALERLVTAYSSHSFVIDRVEAEELFKNVRKPTATEEQLVEDWLSESPGRIMRQSASDPFVAKLNSDESIDTEIDTDTETNVKEDLQNEGDRASSVGESQTGEAPEGITSDQSANQEQSAENESKSTTRVVQLQK